MTTERKIVIVVLIAALVAYGLLMRSCGIKSVTKRTGSDTAINRDTAVVVIAMPPMPVFIRYDSIEFVGVANTIYETDTVKIKGDEVMVILPTDTAGIIRDWNATVFYRDEKDLPRGRIVIEDSLRRNRLVHRKLTSYGTDTTITNTIVKIPPRRIVGYWTGSLGGDFGRLTPRSAGIGLGLKFPGDMVIQAEVKAVNDHRKVPDPVLRSMVEARLMIPIRLKKRK